MGRPRNRGNVRLPPYVYKSKGRYFLRQYLGTRDGKTSWGKDIWLTPESAPIENVWAAYSALGHRHAAGTLAWLADQYFDSPHFDRLGEKTKTLYRSYWQTIRSTRTRAGDFGTAQLDAISPGTIRQYLDRRANAPQQANKERSFLSVLFSHAVERDWMRSNPAQKTKPFPTTPRDRYVEDWEYEAIREISLPYVQDAMELSYLCRARMSEVLSFRVEFILPDGLKLNRDKGSKTQIIGWTDRLLAVVECAKSRPSTITSPWIIHNKRGQKILKDTLQSTWGRKMRKALKEGLILERFSFHDLKAKGVSDFEGDKFKASGHKSPRMLAVYDRKLEIVPSTR